MKSSSICILWVNQKQKKIESKNKIESNDKNPGEYSYALCAEFWEAKQKPVESKQRQQLRLCQQCLNNETSISCSSRSSDSVERFRVDWSFALAVDVKPMLYIPAKQWPNTQTQMFMLHCRKFPMKHHYYGWISGNVYVAHILIHSRWPCIFYFFIFEHFNRRVDEISKKSARCGFDETWAAGYTININSNTKRAVCDITCKTHVCRSGQSAGYHAVTGKIPSGDDAIRKKKNINILYIQSHFPIWVASLLVISVWRQANTKTMIKINKTTVGHRAHDYRSFNWQLSQISHQ